MARKKKARIADIAVNLDAPPRASRTGDRVLTILGLSIAAAAAFFPWYVFFNADKFGVQMTNWDGTRDLPDLPPRNVFSVSPLAMTDNTENTAEPLDDLVTATVANTGDRKKRNIKEDQPFPGKSDFRLLHVANGRALIEDSSGMYMVRVGSILPDESRLASLEQREGKWVIVTSNGAVVKRN